MSISEIEFAIERFKNGDPAGAIPILEEAVRQVPTYILGHVMLAQAYESVQDEERAVRAWSRAHSLIPNSPLRSGLAGEPDPDFDWILEQTRDMDPTESAKSGEPSQPASKPAAPAAATIGAGSGKPGGLVLRATDLVKRYRKRSVVKSVSLDVNQGEIVGLLGPNGAGKTTTFYMIVGLVRANAGSVALGDVDLTALPMYERARQGIGYLAQEASIFSQLTVEQNLEAVLEYQPLSKSARKARVAELIEEFGLERIRKSRGYMLSGGERRRTEIARALATRPKFFLLDEPFAGVDPIAVEDIQTVVSGLRDRGIGVLITDHNVHETLAITDRAYLLYEGKILKQGTAEALASDEEVRKRYLGEKFTLERYR
jgi:lipopolysaccharide export system ATP-binding protein